MTFTFNSFVIEGIKPSENKTFSKIQKFYIPMKFLPLLYFLSPEDLEEILTNVIEVNSLNTKIELNELKLSSLLK